MFERFRTIRFVRKLPRPLQHISVLNVNDKEQYTTEYKKSGWLITVERFIRADLVTITKGDFSISYVDQYHQYGGLMGVNDFEVKGKDAFKFFVGECLK